MDRKIFNNILIKLMFNMEKTLSTKVNFITSSFENVISKIHHDANACCPGESYKQHSKIKFVSRVEF